MRDAGRGPGPENPSEGESRAASLLETTGTLLALAGGGDERARDRLAARYLQALRRWARGRLPQGARDLVDTDDVVQSAIYRAMNRVGEFENRGSGAFLAYMRQILLNQIRDESRRARRRPVHGVIPEDLGTGDPSPLEQLISQEKLARYEQSLAALVPSQRGAIILRLEMGLRYREIAETMGLPSDTAARMLVSRGVVNLAVKLGEHA